MNRRFIAVASVLCLGCHLCGGFVAPSRLTAVTNTDNYDLRVALSPTTPTKSFRSLDSRCSSKYESSLDGLDAVSQPSQPLLSRLFRKLPTSLGLQPTLQQAMARLDTVHSSGLANVHTQGVSIKGVLGVAKKIWNPKTYLALILFTGFKYKWCFNNIFYWLAVAFGVKWYRARYVYKIPVMDRQPNWNNVITSKEQEKELRAYTCKNCGSTLFMAKSREFLFEGKTGIGGLGCFNCGTKGNDNFVSDRDRIVEDVGDLDDYFAYERPLDFVTAAERRKLLKETGGDEEMANQLLMERTGQSESQQPASTSQVAPPSDTPQIKLTEPPQAKPSSPSSPIKPTKIVDEDDDDILDVLDMD